MEYTSADNLVRKLSNLSKVEATRKLTEFYAKARFRMAPDEFRRQYTDGSNDGGIDFYHREDSTYFIFQTKFAGNPKRVADSEVRSELRKLKNSIAKENPNLDADDFVTSLKRDVVQETALLEILWLTTNIFDQSLRDSIQSDLEEWRKVKEALVGLTPDVRRMEKALKLCLEFLQTGEIQPRGERHPYSLWAAAVSSGHMALGQRLRKGEDGILRWRRIQKLSTNTFEGSRK